MSSASPWLLFSSLHLVIDRNLWNPSEVRSNLWTLERPFRKLIGIAAACFILLFLGIALIRITYPFELEWMEGGQVDHILRILRGQKIYVQPSLEFVPFVYNPLYYYLAAAVSAITTPGFVALRSISLVASLGVLWFLFLMVKRETGSSFCGLASAGFFAASYPLSGGWFDMGRGDSLFLFLLAAGAFVIRFRRSQAGAIVAGLLFFLSFLVKQTAVFPAGALTLYLFFENRRSAIFFAAFSLGLSALAILILNSIHDGWYMYTISSAGNIPLEHAMLVGFWTRDLFPTVPIALVLSALCLIHVHKEGGSMFRFYGLLTASMLFISWSGRYHNGGFTNVLMTIHFQMAILVGLALRHFALVAASIRTRSIVLLAVIAQFVLMIYNPQRLLPTAADRIAGEQFVQRLRGIQGDVLIPYHGFYSTMAGKDVHAHIMTMIEVVLSGDADLSNKLVTEIQSQIRDQRFAAIVLDREWFREDVEKYYVNSGKVFTDPTVFWPITGYRTRPEWIYLPRKR